MMLERVIGLTALHNSAVAVSPVSGDLAYPAGCVVVVVPRRGSKQVKRRSLSADRGPLLTHTHSLSPPSLSARRVC